MLIDRFFKAGREFLGCKYPIMCGAMTWISDPNLVCAVGEAGGFGLLAGGNVPADVFRNQVVETREMSKTPFGVNIITLAPVYKDHFDLVCDLGCEFVVFEFAKLQLELLHKLDNCVIDREEAQVAVERFWVGALKDAPLMVRSPRAH